MPFTEKELIDRINARLRGVTFPLVVTDDCFICGKPATGYIVRSENPCDKKPVCSKCGGMVTLGDYQRGRHVVIMSPDHQMLSRISPDFVESIKRFT